MKKTKAHKEVYIEGSTLEIEGLFNILRANGVEASFPEKTASGNYYILALPGTLIDKILCSWKDFVRYKLVNVQNEY